jgi:DNA-directed RNA polymerase
MTLSDAQEASEKRGLTDGELRYIRRCEKAYSHGAATGSPPVRHFMEAVLEWLEADLKIKMEEIIAGPGPMPLWAEWVLRTGEAQASYLTLKAALNGIALHPDAPTTGRKLRAVCTTLMSSLVDEQRAETFIAADVAGYANAVNHRANTKLARSLRLRKRMIQHGVAVPPTPGSKETMDVGSHLLMAMCQSTGAFTIEEVRDHSSHRYRTSLVLKPVPETLEWIRLRSDRLRLTMPLHPPTLIPPKDWSQGVAGGYHFGLAGTLPLVRNSTPAQDAKVAAEPMPLVYAALSALARTPWRINQRVLEIVKLALDGKIPDLIPGPDAIPIPVRPVDQTDKDANKAWRIAASNTHALNDRRRIRRSDAERSVVVACQVENDERFYYPYSLDFRGRAYPAVEFLNPHGPDVVRGMLEFADGVNITKTGAGWLAVHGSNNLGTLDAKSLTKLSFQERVDVIRGLSDRISRVAEDPVGSSHLWTTADDPWQFLAFCFEWDQWLKTGALTTHLPVGLDGTANGLQHFSALLRDPVAAAAVNMTNTNRPADLYAVVAQAVTEKLQSRASEPIAALWLSSGLVTRALVKRPVMTLAYGATRYGFTDQILSTLRADDVEWAQTRKLFGAAHVRIRVAVQYLSAILWDTLQTTVGGALRAMEWLQDAATAVVKVTGGPISWSVPMTGFPAHAEYWKSRRQQITTRMSGSVLAPSAWLATTSPQMSKIRNAISPNVVHSLDAAAMMSCVVACAARGVGSFSAIHDSYAVSAEYIPVLADCIRTTFIDLYQGRNILQELAEQWRKTGAEIPDPPQLGTFDVQDVRHAQFFFN